MIFVVVVVVHHHEGSEETKKEVRPNVALVKQVIITVYKEDRNFRINIL